MTNQRQRPVLFATITIVAAWLLAWGGYSMSKNSKMTVEKLRTYVQSVDPNRLSAKERGEAIRTLTAKINALTLEERQQARMEGVWRQWFEQMTDEEKHTFIEATTPAGFKEMLTAFDSLSENQRRKAIGDAVRRLKEARDTLGENSPEIHAAMTNRGPVVTLEMEQRVREVGLKTFYEESPVQRKAELAPILDELQRLMNSGAIARSPK